MWFEAIFGLKINIEKSELILVGRVDDLEDLASILGCRVWQLPSTCLGLPLGIYFKSVIVQDVVEERFQNKLALRKR